MVAPLDFPRRPVAASRRSPGRHAARRRRFASKIRDYIFGSYIDEVLCMVKANGDRYWFSTNDLYSVYALTDSNGDPVERYMYSPYGACTVLAADGVTVRAESLYGNPWTFTGRRLDQETGLMYFRNRMYEVGLGRFTGRDPWRAEEDEPLAMDGYPDGMSLYFTYFVPNRRDPYGLDGRYGQQNFGDLLSFVKAQVGPGECIGTLDIGGHGSPWHIRLGPIGEERIFSGSLSDNVINDKNADFIGGQLNAQLKFCCECRIYLSSCHSGNLRGDATWPQVIADKTGCEVTASLGFLTGWLSGVHTIRTYLTSPKEGKGLPGDEETLPSECATRIFQPYWTRRLYPGTPISVKAEASDKRPPAGSLTIDTGAGPVEVPIGGFGTRTRRRR